MLSSISDREHHASFCLPLQGRGVQDSLFWCWRGFHSASVTFWSWSYTDMQGQPPPGFLPLILSSYHHKTKSLDLWTQALLVGDKYLCTEHSSHFLTLMNYSTWFFPLCTTFRFSLSSTWKKSFLFFFFISPLIIILKMNCLLALFLDRLTYTFHTRDGFVLLLQVHHLYQSLPYVAWITGLKHSKSIEQFSLAFTWCTI